MPVHALLNIAVRAARNAGEIIVRSMNRLESLQITDEIDANFNNGPFVSAFAEYRPSPRTTLRVDVDNVFESTGNRRRLLFSPNRTTPDPFREEYRSRSNHVSVTFTLRRGFGSSSGARQSG